mgnify:CR=1 FL=1
MKITIVGPGAMGCLLAAFLAKGKQEVWLLDKDPQRAEKIKELRGIISQIYVDEKVKEYILDLVFATRDPAQYKLESLKPLIAYGASPRASIMLTLASKAHAFMRGRGYVTPDDVKQIGMDVLRHRVLITYEAEAEDMTPETIIKKIFDQIEVP